MIRYPDSLPAPLLSTGMSSVATTNRTKMRSGRTRQRNIFTSAPASSEFVFIMSGEQALEFEAWFESTNYGQEWFLLPRLTPAGYDHHQFRFTSMYQGANYRGVDRWEIRLSAEMAKREYLLSGDFTELPEYLLEANIIDFAVNMILPDCFGFKKHYEMIDVATNEMLPKCEE